MDVAQSFAYQLWHFFDSGCMYVRIFDPGWDWSGNTLSVGVVAAGISPSQSRTALLDHCRHTPSRTVPLQAIKFPACDQGSKQAQVRKKKMGTLTVTHLRHKALTCAVYYYKAYYVRSIRFVVKGPMKWLWDCNLLPWCDVFLHGFGNGGREKRQERQRLQSGHRLLTDHWLPSLVLI